MSLGCDTATRVTSAHLKAIQNEGMTFIGRYLNRLDGSHDELTESEAKLISDAGLYIVSFYQARGTTSPSHFTFENGMADGEDAIRLANNIGQRKGSPIYFPVDFDASTEVIESNIANYLRGLEYKIKYSDYLLGIYGSPNVCEFCRSYYSATKRYTCVSDCGWSGDFDDWNLRQYNHDTPLSSGILVDYEESSSHGGGGWSLR